MFGLARSESLIPEKSFGVRVAVPGKERFQRQKIGSCLAGRLCGRIKNKGEVSKMHPNAMFQVFTDDKGNQFTLTGEVRKASTGETFLGRDPQTKKFVVCVPPFDSLCEWPILKPYHKVAQVA